LDNNGSDFTTDEFISERTTRWWGLTGGNRSLGVCPWKSHLVPWSYFCFLDILKWAVFHCMFPAVMLCLTMAFKQWSQMTIDWNLQTHKPKYLVLPLTWFSQVFCQSERRWLTQETINPHLLRVTACWTDPISSLRTLGSQALVFSSKQKHLALVTPSL
jgi:hypothetical protein